MHMGKFNLMSLDEAKEKSTEPGYIVVDLRSEKEYYNSHIENAMNIPMATVEKIECFNKKEYLWILYCNRGSLSFKLASEMADKGYRVYSVVGGYK